MSSARSGENTEIVMGASLGTPLKRRHTQSGIHYYSRRCTDSSASLMVVKGTYVMSHDTSRLRLKYDNHATGNTKIMSTSFKLIES